MIELQAEDIRRFAASIGIPSIGFAKPVPGPEAQQLKAWLEKKFHAGMGYFEKDIRVRTLEEPLLPGQKAMVICLFPYPALLMSPHVSAYALFPDYHRYLNRKLSELKQLVELKAPGIAVRVFADSSPVMEKPLAVRAGLGFQGKNTLLISPEYGSYCFLGGLILDCEIADDSRSSVVPEGCGSCRLCIDACPTQALSGEGLDGRRCLSYHNIENRGEIPDDIQDEMGMRVFGCGICEQVCPKNHGAKQGNYPDWQGEKQLAQRDLKGLFDDCFKGFGKHFGETPIHRLGKKRLMRNLLVAMGNSGQNDYISCVEKCADEPGLEKYAARAMRKLGNKGSE